MRVFQLGPDVAYSVADSITVQPCALAVGVVVCRPGVFHVVGGNDEYRLVGLPILHHMTLDVYDLVQRLTDCSNL